MRFACLLQHRKRLLMQLDQTAGTANTTISASSSLLRKRPFTQSSPDGNNKHIKLDSQRNYATQAVHHHTSPQMVPPPRAGGSRRDHSHSNRFGVRQSTKPTLDGPLRDLKYINEENKDVNLDGLKKAHLDEPKSTVNNIAALNDIAPRYTTVSGQVMEKGARKSISRTHVRIDFDVPIETFGDGVDRKSSERAAAKSALFQMQKLGLMNPRRTASKNVTTGTTTLANGAVVDYEQARNFMDFYCRRFGFGKPEIAFKNIGGKSWEACMSVGTRRIGIGMADNKKSANIEAFLDVTRYLDSCDPELWKTFEAAVKAGTDLPMAPPVYFQMSHGLDDEIRDLCHDIRKSKLYLNRPSAVAPQANAEATETAPVRHVPPPSTAMLKLKSAALSRRHAEYMQNPQLERIRSTRMSLPVYSQASTILSHIRENDVTICMAATGSGKTTQIPQLILDEAIELGHGGQCNVVCTQPRRLAAISVADRVAKERGETLGKSIGYQVRFETKPPEAHGSVTFCTTGVFLKRLQSGLGGHNSYGGNNSLDDITHVVVDEVHERDVDTDLLLVVLKRMLADRKSRGKPLKIILMSATIDPSLFQNYFMDDNNQPASVTEIPGRSFPVTKFFLEDFVPKLISPPTRWLFQDRTVANYLRKEMDPAVLGPLNVVSHIMEGRDDDLELPFPLIAMTISHVLQKTDSGHVLVFLPGWEEIVATQRAILTPNGSLGLNLADTKSYSVHLLHSSIPLQEQQVIFEPSPNGVRRIILATNIAETSITIPDVVYVVDTAKIKEQRFDPERHMSSLVSAWVGSSNLNQRAGRAGRHRSGEYFGILGRQHAENLHPYQTVEMKRVDLSNVLMHVKALNFPGITVEEVLAATIEPPAADRVAAAIKNLQMVGALDTHKSLTSLGRVLLQLPVETQMGRLVLYGSFFRCLDQALTLAAILTNRDPFLSPIQMKAEASARKNSWTPVEFRSDALATLRAYNAWWELQAKGDQHGANRFCVDNFLSKPTLFLIQKIKAQLLQSLYHAGVIDISAGGMVDNGNRVFTIPRELNVNGASLPLLGALITVATQPKYAVRVGQSTYRTSQDKTTVIHPSSVNNRRKEPSSHPDGEKELYAYLEKRMNTTSSNTNPQMFLVTTTRLDPMTYMLFGAHKVEVSRRGMDCDGWLPIIGNVDALDDIHNLKTLMEACMLRVFEGITMGSRQRGRQYLTILPREEESESGEEDSDRKDYSMSPMEMKELDLLTRDIVRILNRYSDERIASQSRQNSQPATPMGSPALNAFGMGGRLPGIRSGYTTPQRSRHF